MAIVNSSRPDPIMKIYSVNLRYASSVRFDWLKKLKILIGLGPDV